MRIHRTVYGGTVWWCVREYPLCPPLYFRRHSEARRFVQRSEREQTDMADIGRRLAEGLLGVQKAAERIGNLLRRCDLA